MKNFVNSLIKVMKIFFTFFLLFLNSCAPPFHGPGTYVGGLDAAAKSKEILTNSECTWRCYDKNTLSGLEKRLDKLFGQK